MNKPSIKFTQSQITGLLWGGILGDCIGRVFEGKNPTERVDTDLDYPFYTTDDTQLTLATCEAIDKDLTVDPEKIAQRFRYWFEQSKIYGIGASTLRAMRNLSAGQHWALAGNKGEYASGNGAAMRIAPLALIVDPFNSSDREVIKDVCRITHNDDEAYLGALAILIAIRFNLMDCNYDLESVLRDVAIELPDSRVRDRLNTLNNESAKYSLLECVRKYGNSGYVVESVPFTLFALKLLRETNYKSAIIDIVKCGGDADTVASMYGQIVGARVGYELLPKDLIKRVEEKDEMERIVEGFLRRIS